MHLEHQSRIIIVYIDDAIVILKHLMNANFEGCFQLWIAHQITEALIWNIFFLFVTI